MPDDPVFGEGLGGDALKHRARTAHEGVDDTRRNHHRVTGDEVLRGHVVGGVGGRRVEASRARPDQEGFRVRVVVVAERVGPVLDGDGADPQDGTIGKTECSLGDGTARVLVNDAVLAEGQRNSAHRFSGDSWATKWQ